MSKLVLGALVLALLVPGAAAAGDVRVQATGPAISDDEVPLFVGGGTFLTNGYFFPGTAIYDGEKFVGVPYQINKGDDIMFVNLDYGPLTNGHQIQSIKRRKKSGRPLFQSKRIEQPGQSTLMITSHLKPRVYAYRCTVHFNQYGLIEVVKG